MIRIHSRTAYTRIAVILWVFLCKIVANLFAAMYLLPSFLVIYTQREREWERELREIWDRSNNKRRMLSKGDKLTKDEILLRMLYYTLYFYL